MSEATARNNDLGRARYVAVTDSQVLDAFALLSRMEGIIPALEPAHALAWVVQDARALAGKTVIPGLINAHGHVGAKTEPQLRQYALYGVTTVNEHADRSG